MSSIRIAKKIFKNNTKCKRVKVCYEYPITNREGVVLYHKKIVHKVRNHKGKFVSQLYKLRLNGRGSFAKNNLSYSLKQKSIRLFFV